AFGGSPSAAVVTQSSARSTFSARRESSCSSSVNDGREPINVSVLDARHASTVIRPSAAASTTRGYTTCSTREAPAGSVAAAALTKTGTGNCVMMHPRSYTSLTKCAVTPLTRTPASITAWCTRCPYIPGPPNAGSSAGCTLIIRPSYLATTDGGTSRR